LRPEEAIASLSNTSLVSIEREQGLRSGLWKFVQLAWPKTPVEQLQIDHPVEPELLVPGWHMEEICNHLEAVSRGELRRLIINVPPGTSKSTLTSVLWPAWDWIRYPKRKWITGTQDVGLMRRDSNRCRGLLRSEWYRERWGLSVDESGEVQDTQAIWHTTAGGRRVSVTVGGAAIGWHSEIQLIDDPHKPKDLAGDPDVAQRSLERVWSWFTLTMSSRRTNPRKFARVIIMQRLHEGDLTGRILNSDGAKEWTHLMLPMRFERERVCVTAWGGDRRRAPELYSRPDLPVDPVLLCPARFDAVAVEEMRKGVGGLGERGDAAQNQQRPNPAGGNVFKREWFAKFWLPVGHELWSKLTEDERTNVVPYPVRVTEIQSWDCAFKDRAGAALTAGHVWGYDAANFYLRDRIADNLSLPTICNCVRAFKRRHPRARGVLIEDKANGPAVEQTLRKEVSGIIMWEPHGGKIAQANAVTPIAQAGNIIFPHPLLFPWVDEMMELILGFPFSASNDDTDAMCQAILHLHDNIQPGYLSAMRKVRDGSFRVGER